jgi:integrase
MLLSPLAGAILFSGLVTARLSFHAQTLALAAVYSAGLMAEIEFMWTLFQLRSRWIHIGCGLRRAEVVAVKIEDLQLREDH